VNRRRTAVAAAGALATTLAFGLLATGTGATPSTGTVGPRGVSVGFDPVANGLPSPVQVTSARDGSRRLFVVEQGGRVRIVSTGTVRSKAYLDLTGRVVSGGEQGLLGLTFHPRFETKHFLYVAYTRASDGALQVSRFTASSATATSVAMSTERRIITVPHPGQSNHNGGGLAFGAHGLLLISTGDGGGGGDPYDNARDLTSLSGKLLRLDVDRRCGARNYCIPDGNPFAHAKNANKRTVFDWGLRNPWRISVDRGDGRLWIADVGQQVWEEIDHVRQRGGRDFGWSCLEGRHSYDPSRCAMGGEPRRMTAPVAEYNHDAGRCAVIGGYAYRGRTYEFARGIYVYSDYCGGQVYGVKQRADGSHVHALVGHVSGVTGYGENDRGEIYAVSQSGTLFRVVFRRR
jgi:glucose/arabinose dehydrogenase